MDRGAMSILTLEWRVGQGLAREEAFLRLLWVLLVLLQVVREVRSPKVKDTPRECPLQSP